MVRISLAQVGKWNFDLGEVPAAALGAIPAEFTADELERWSTTRVTPSGRLSHLKPVVQLSETPPYWARPSVPLWLSLPRMTVVNSMTSTAIGDYLRAHVTRSAEVLSKIKLARGEEGGYGVPSYHDALFRNGSTGRSERCELHRRSTRAGHCPCS